MAVPLWGALPPRTPPVRRDTLWLLTPLLACPLAARGVHLYSAFEKGFCEAPQNIFLCGRKQGVPPTFVLECCRPKTSRLATNSTLIDGLSFCARYSGSMTPCVSCRDNGQCWSGFHGSGGRCFA